jgi:3-methyl-2-oxobutanoate hydroxymethyltransferase
VLLAQYSRPALFAARPLLSQCQGRFSSHSPMGSSGPNLRKKVTLNSIRTLYKKGEPIAVLTAHDFPSGHVADAAGMEIILVGDSLAMVAMGMEDTSEVLLEEMLLHCRSVSRAAKTSFVVSFPRPPNRLKANHYPRLVTCLWDRMRSPLSKH